MAVIPNILFVGKRGLSIDVDVSDYSSRVQAAGGSLSGSELSAINIFTITLKVSGIWAKITDIAPVMGGFNGCLVKLKYSDDAVKSMVSDGTANFVAGDYALVNGLTSVTTNKRLKIGCVPTDAGLSNTNLSINYLSNISLVSAGSKVVISDRQSPFKIDIRTTSARLNNAAYANYSADLDLAGTTRPVFTSIILGATVNMFNDWKNPVLSSLTSPVMTLNNDLYVFNDASSYYDGNIGSIFIGQSLTSSEYLSLYAAVLQLYRTIGRIPAATASDYFFGDSITAGLNASSATLKYSYLRSVADSRREVNSGITASPFISSGSYTQPGGFIRRGELVRYINDNPGTVFHMMYGVNDITLNSSTQYATYMLMTEWTVKEVLAAGGTFKLSSIPLINTGSATLRTNHIAAALLAAKKLGVPYIDMDAYMSANGGVALLDVDNIHPVNTGHAVIRDGFGIAAVQSPDGALVHMSYFEAPNGTAIGSYVPDTGSVWSSLNSGQWQITQESTVGVLPYYISTTGSPPSGNNWQIQGDLGVTDYTVYFVAQKTNNGDFARFFVRRTDENNMVEVRWTAANAMSFQNYVAGTPTAFGSIAVTPVQGVPHLFKITVSGSDISVQVDFGTVYSATIPTTQSGTKIGLGQLSATPGIFKIYQVYVHQ